MKYLLIALIIITGIAMFVDSQIILNDCEDHRPQDCTFTIN